MKIQLTLWDFMFIFLSFIFILFYFVLFLGKLNIKALFSLYEFYKMPGVLIFFPVNKLGQNNDNGINCSTIMVFIAARKIY